MPTKLEEFFKSLETEEKEVKQEQVVEEKQQNVSQETSSVSELSTEQQTEQKQEEQPVIAGKFRSVDDLINSYQELERKFYSLQEQLKRAEQTLEAFSKTQPSVQYGISPSTNVSSASDFEIDVDPLVDPKMFAKKLTEKVTQNVISQVQQQMLLQQQMAEVRKRFYDLNPDLVGKEKLVGLIAQDVAREMPNASLDVVLEEIAKRTRQFLKTLTGQQQKTQFQPVNQTPTPQVSVSREKVPPVEEKELTSDELAQEYIKQRKEFLSKKKI